MKILKFFAENVRGLRVLKIEPNGDDVVLSGPNGSGKSSAIDAIIRTLNGGDLPIRNGADKAQTAIDLGDITVQRIKTEKSDRLLVKSKDGATYPEPRTVLAKLVGNLTIDPTAFARLKGKERIDLLFRLVPGLEQSLQEADGKIETIKADRSEVLAAGTRVKVELEKMPEVADAPAQEVSMAELLDEFNMIALGNKELADKRKALDKIINATADKLSEVDDITAKIKALVEYQDKIKAEISALKKQALEIGDVPADVDPSPIRSQMASAEAQNAKYRLATSRTAKQNERDDLADKYTTLGAALKNAEAARAGLLESAAMPVPGLSVSGLDVIFNGVPVDQLSTAEKIRIGTAIAVAQKPKAEIILVDDASLLDQKSMAILKEVAAGFQIWTVVNDESGEKGFYIEDGAIVEKSKSPVAGAGLEFAE